MLRATDDTYQVYDFQFSTPCKPICDCLTLFLFVSLYTGNSFRRCYGLNMESNSCLISRNEIAAHNLYDEGNIIEYCQVLQTESSPNLNRMKVSNMVRKKMPRNSRLNYLAGREVN